MSEDYQNDSPYSDEEVEAAAEEQQVHEEAAQKRAGGPGLDFDNYDDAVADLEEKRQKLSEAIVETQAAEQNLPDLKVRLEQARVDELKQQEPQYGDDGRLLGVGIGERAGEVDEEPQPVSFPPRMYGAVVDPATIRGVV